MTLLITVFAAVISTVVWYSRANKKDTYYTGFLALMYTAASVMWTVDLIFEYAEVGSECFYPSAADMLNDAYLGFAAVALGLVIWALILIIKDPKHIRQREVAKWTK